MDLSGRSNLARAIFFGQVRSRAASYAGSQETLVCSRMPLLWEAGAVLELVLPGSIQALGPETGTVK